MYRDSSGLRLRFARTHVRIRVRQIRLPARRSHDLPAPRLRHATQPARAPLQDVRDTRSATHRDRSECFSSARRTPGSGPTESAELPVQRGHRMTGIDPNRRRGFQAITSRAGKPTPQIFESADPRVHTITDHRVGSFSSAPPPRADPTRASANSPPSPRPAPHFRTRSGRSAAVFGV
jgi:hypothetical protein